MSELVATTVLSKTPRMAAWRALLIFTIPPDRPVITGGVSPATPTSVPIPFKLPKAFDDGRIIPFETPMGPLNVRFEKIRELP
jgi:hypothetical protein